MFILDENMGITISRGDTAALEITLSGDTPNDPNDKVVASLKPTPEQKRAIWRKELTKIDEDTWLMAINSEDTESLGFREYSWDIRVFYADGNVTTLFNPQPFVVSPVVTDNDR